MGIVYYIYCDISNDILDVANRGIERNFIGYYMNGWSNKDRAIAVMYFMFTTLSTVGFGDFHPINEYEAAFTAAVLLFGVSIFSYLMGTFIAISDSCIDLNEEFDDGEELSKFFEIMKKYNKSICIKIELKKDIEEFFAYKWCHDKNLAISSE